MNNHRSILIKVCIIVLYSWTLSGCTDNLLDLSPTTSISDADVWEDIGLVQKYVTNTYNGINWPTAVSGTNPVFTDALTDNSVCRYDYGTWPYAEGHATSTDAGIFNDIWGQMYGNIQKVNVFLSKIEAVDAEEEVKQSLIGQERFIRAWNYAQLVELYGGVPLITEPSDLSADFSKVKRNSYQECIEFIVSELDKVISNAQIPEVATGGDLGRVDKAAARAKKSEVLLYAASKLHDPGSEPGGPLFDYDVASKWQDAADAAKAVIDMPQFSLVQVSNAKDYQDLFLHTNSEIIFQRVTNSQFSHLGSLDQKFSPNGLKTPASISTYNPTQNIVDEFQMKDGKSIEESAMYDPSPATIYKNRELRFYADIVYNGAEYRGETMQFYLPDGNQSQYGPGGAGQYSLTGYTVRKYMDESYDWTSPEKAVTPRIYFRLAEIYLNYAEAEYHLGHEDVAREYVNKIRNRVHLPDISSSGQQLLKDIMHERTIELFFEDRYFYDARRWMTAEASFKDALGISWKYVDADGKLISPSQPGARLTYSIVTAQERSFPARQYYAPIPLAEIQNSSIEQNPGY